MAYQSPISFNASLPNPYAVPKPTKVNAIFDAIDNGKLPILDSNWMKKIKYRYRAMNMQQFHYQYLRILEDGFEKNKKQFDRLKKGLEKYTDKQKWIKQILEVV